MVCVSVMAAKIFDPLYPFRNYLRCEVGVMEMGEVKELIVEE